MQEAWPSVVRFVAGVFWLYFASQKWLGFLLAANLALTVAFDVSDDGFRWLYYLAVIVNAQVIVSGPGSIALGRFGWVPEWLR